MKKAFIVTFVTVFPFLVVVEIRAEIQVRKLRKQQHRV